MDIGEVALAGQGAWFHMLADSGAGESWIEGSAMAVVTGLCSNSDNGVVVDRSALKNDRVARSLLNRVLDRCVPASLIVTEHASDPEIRLLAVLGLQPENSARGMGRPIDVRPTLAIPAGVEISEVCDDGGPDALRRRRVGTPARCRNRAYSSAPAGSLRRWGDERSFVAVAQRLSASQSGGFRACAVAAKSVVLSTDRRSR